MDEEREAGRALSMEAAGKDFEVQRLDQMEARRRDKEEAEAKREDRKKIKKIEGEDPASLMAAVSKMNDPLSYRARTALSLPAPQVPPPPLLPQPPPGGELRCLRARGPLLWSHPPKP